MMESEQSTIVPQAHASAKHTDALVKQKIVAACPHLIAISTFFAIQFHSNAIEYKP